MNTIDLKLPVFAFPVQDAENPCPCQERPMELTYKEGQIFWDVASGELVQKGTPVATLEVEKKTLEIEAPATGRIQLRCDNGALVDSGSILASIEVI